jgi:hypothetical protein
MQAVSVQRRSVDKCSPARSSPGRLASGAVGERKRGASGLLVAVVAGVTLEVGLLLGVAGFYAVGLLGGRATDAGVAGATAALAALLAGFLWLCALALWRGRRWARGPVITWQLLTVLAGVSSGLFRSALGAAVLALAVGVGAGLLAPSVVRTTTSRADPPVT